MRDTYNDSNRIIHNPNPDPNANTNQNPNPIHNPNSKLPNHEIIRYTWIIDHVLNIVTAFPKCGMHVVHCGILMRKSA